MLSTIERYIMSFTQPRRSNSIVRRTGYQGALSASVLVLTTAFEKSATEPKQRLLKIKSTITISTFNVRTLSRISQLSELVASAATYNIDIISIQENDMTMTFEICLYTIGGIVMLLSPLALKSTGTQVID